MSHKPGPIKSLQPLIIAMVLMFAITANRCNDKSTETVAKAKPTGKIVVGYYFNSGDGYDATQILYGNLTHVAHAFAIPNSDGTLNIDGISSQISGFSQAVHQNNKKAVLSVGGWGGGANFSGIASDPNKRHVFASALKMFCVSNKYDGVDIDWEYPTFRERSNVTSLLRELSDTLRVGKTPFTVSIAIPFSIGATGFALTDIDSLLDWIGVMTYDYTTCVSSTADLNAPLSKIESDVTVLLASVSPKKLLMGFPFYGRQYHCPSGPSLGASTDGCVEMPFATLPDFSQGGWQRRWDTSASVPYLLNESANLLISYDDQQSIQSKCQWLKGKNLGGAIMWALGQDGSASNQPLLCTIGKELLGTGCPPSYDFGPRPISLAAPTLSLGVTIETRDPALKWSVSPGATFYTVQSSNKLETFAFPKIIYSGPDRSYSFGHDFSSYSGSYYRVRAENQNLRSGWSDTVKFTK